MEVNEKISLLQNFGALVGETLYEIAFRNAGVALVWHSDEKAGPRPEELTLHEYVREMGEWTKRGLVVYKYYPTLEDAIAGETDRLISKRANSTHVSYAAKS